MDCHENQRFSRNDRRSKATKTHVITRNEVTKQSSQQWIATLLLVARNGRQTVDCHENQRFSRNDKKEVSNNYPKK